MLGFHALSIETQKIRKTQNIHLMVALSGSMSKNISSSTSNCMIGLWSAAVRYNFAEKRPSWNSPYKRAKAHDLRRRSLVEKSKCYKDFTAYHQLASQQIILYSIIQQERSIFWEVIVIIIVRKEVYMDKCLILSGYQDRAVWIYKYKRTVELYIGIKKDKLLTVNFIKLLFKSSTYFSILL